MINNKEHFDTPGTTGTTGLYKWRVNADGTLTITDYDPPILAPQLLNILNIPSILDNKTVTIIGASSFNASIDFDTVFIPKTVTEIQDSAFSDCSQLKYLGVYYDGSLKIIGPSAFARTVIMNPTIPATVQSIGNNAFATKTLYSVTFLGNCPIFTSSAFSAGNPVGYDGVPMTFNNKAEFLNTAGKIIIYCFNDKTGFNNLDTKFIVNKVPELNSYTSVAPNPVWAILIIVIFIVLLLYGAAKLI